MKLLNPFLDKLQALLPPNRVAILLAGTITALSGTISAWLATHAPGLNLGQLEVAAVLTAAVLITVRLLDKWFDQWQAGEPIHVEADLADAFDEILEGHKTIDYLIGTTAGARRALEDLRNRIDRGEVNEAEIATEIESISLTALSGTPDVEVASPAVAVPPTATTPS